MVVLLRGFVLLLLVLRTGYTVA